MVHDFTTQSSAFQCIESLQLTTKYKVHYSHLGDEGIGEGGLAVVDVRDHGHVPDVLLLVHAFPHLVGCEVNLQKVSHEKILEAGKEGMSGGTGDLSLFKC